jgi:hypothetical protein
MVLLERKSVRPTTNLRQRLFDPALLKDAASARAEYLKEWRKAEAAGCWLLIRLWPPCLPILALLLIVRTVVEKPMSPRKDTRLRSIEHPERSVADPNRASGRGQHQGPCRRVGDVVMRARRVIDAIAAAPRASAFE